MGGGSVCLPNSSTISTPPENTGEIHLRRAIRCEMVVEILKMWSHYLLRKWIAALVGHFDRSRACAGGRRGTASISRMVRRAGKAVDGIERLAQAADSESVRLRAWRAR